MNQLFVCYFPINRLQYCSKADSSHILNSENQLFNLSVMFLIKHLSVKVKVKLSLCFNFTPCHEGILGEWLYSCTLS